VTGLEARLVARRGAFSLDIVLEVQRGQTLALLGPNGAGKSTAIGCLAGIVPLEAGRVRVGDRVLEDASTGEYVETRARRVGVVFQDYLLFPHLSVRENVAFGPRAMGLRRAEAREKAAAWLDRLAIGELADRRPPELSGGQAQRVALARALAAEPEALLLDEPLAALDAEVREDVRQELASHLAAFDGVTIVVTHSLDDVVALAGTVAVLESGRITQRSSVRDLVRSPATAYIERLVSRWSED
jgi:molybdate transport system ATP-binding protein